MIPDTMLQKGNLGLKNTFWGYLWEMALENPYDCEKKESSTTYKKQSIS